MNETGKQGTETVPMNLDEALAVWIYLQGSEWYGPTEQEAGKRAQETVRIYALEAMKRVAGVPDQEHIPQKPGQKPGLLPNGNTAEQIEAAAKAVYRAEYGEDGCDEWSVTIAAAALQAAKAHIISASKFDPANGTYTIDATTLLEILK